MVISLRSLRMCGAMKIAICDDYITIATELKTNIETICAQKDWTLECKVFASSIALLNADLSGVQVVFLDIDMPEINGLDAAKALRGKYPELIIVFVTSYIEYAPAGYRVAAFRYLLKQRLDEELPCVLEDVQRKLLESEELISVRTKSGFVDIPLKDVLYLEGTPGREVVFHMSRFETIKASGRLTQYEEKLRGKGFLRLQKSFIANMAHICRISNYQAFLDNGAALKTSEIAYRDIQTTFLQWKGLHI